MSMNRRQALGQILKISGAAAGGAALSSTSVFAAEGEAWSLTPADLNTLAYAKLDPIEVAKIAYDADVKNKGCMYQVFHALITALAESDSPDAAKFAQIPTAMSIYGSGGIFGLGTVCGNNNAAGMLYKLISVNGNKPTSIHEVSAYYQHTMLPYNDAEFLTALGVTQEDYDANVVVQTKANSLLCHASLTRWADASGKAVATKGMRCQLLSASMAYRIAEILNAEMDATPIADAPKYSDDMNSCTQCHTKAADSMGTSVMTGMECDACHN